MRLPSSPRAVVTGAASGFGRAISLRLAARHARLVISDIDEEGLAQTAELIREAGGEVRTIACDVREPEQVEAQADLAEEAWGGTDVVINNAGVAVAGRVGDVPLENWRWQIEINLWGVIHGCHVFVPRMRAQGSGWILNVASSAGLLSAPTMGPYNVSKAGVIALSETLYGELLDTKVHVSALCPTFFRTNIHKNARASSEPILEQTSKLITGSKWSAEAIADIAIEGLERGELYVIPQLDGKLMWGAKRLMGQGFHGMAGRALLNPKLLRRFMRR
ncbi:SDR family NAD(P)-dependent oxidoreductase [Pseudenhygromyxa sp. WMMC2535]|uniref:SDR family NAD(P)-dependent oxidoreductase n=1 Tax=Pseudenhygromyxa sp. WMMC2535 TaxID=2712867 RepID=UPI00155510D4|nr:SDR family NAD(P)-dependent oxidoreductase [Pseudenhygromyxa sp. WMMC2535]NVB40677.1 SDR family NAD(P)-dependent oxidoreductase [Pseudenhygromyxa sp. WMMC2535]